MSSNFCRNYSQFSVIQKWRKSTAAAPSGGTAEQSKVQDLKNELIRKIGNNAANRWGSTKIRVVWIRLCFTFVWDEG
jgi:hypothetical protein